MPVFFHNLTGYDSHLFIKEIAQTFPNDTLSVIPLNHEKYISFSQKISEYFEIRYLQSYRFMASSLDEVSKTLDKNKFNILDKSFGNVLAKFLKRKGVFPYEYVNSFLKLKETQLPPIEMFFSKLTQKNISIKDYEYAKKIWKKFNIQNLGEYSDLYLKTDVLLLADVFENFRDICYKIYNLDPKHYFTAPGLSWDAMLKFSEVELELISDVDMLHFLKKGIRGGVSQCSGRYSKANNKYMTSYNPDEESKFLMYVDATNLYGWAMSRKLPYDQFRWLNENEITQIDLDNIDGNSKDGYIFEVDLEYPQNVHDYHNDYPFCPENIIPPNGALPKLIPNLYDKTKYIIHQNALKQCLNSGLKLLKIHRVLAFRQKNWLKSYIDLNIKHRQNAKNEFEKMFFKLMINAVYGKTMENIEKRRDVKLITNWKKNGNRHGAEFLIAKPNFHFCTIFDENFVAIEMKRTQFIYNKPIYVGLAVLDISKTLMYYFHYNIMKSKYQKNLKILYTDTDSFIYEIKTDDLYMDIKNDKSLLEM